MAQRRGPISHPTGAFARRKLHVGMILAFAAASLALDTGPVAAAGARGTETAADAIEDASQGMPGIDRPLSAVDAAAELAGRAPGSAAQPTEPTEPIPAPPEQVEWSSNEAPSSSAEPVLAEGGTLSTEVPAAEETAVAAVSDEVAVVDPDGTPAVEQIDVGGSPVSVSLAAEDGAKVSADAVSPQLAVSVLDSALTEQAGFNRVAFTIDVSGLDAEARAEGMSEDDAGTLAKSVQVNIAVDYSAFVDEFGADWAGRLRLVRFEPCAVAPTDNVDCPPPTVVDGFTNDVANLKVTATLPLDALVDAEPGLSATSAAGTTSGFALLAGPSSATGDYSTTSLNPQGSWAVGAQSGDFSWSYPVNAPAPPAGSAPGVSVGYSSGAIDGLTSDQNTQGGVLGPGWSLSEGFIERSYKSCGADGGAGADFCWVTDNATFSFAGMSDKLIRVGSEISGMEGWDAAVFRLESHTGWIVKRYALGVSDRGGFGVDDNREYWLAISPDGNRYYFGYGNETGDGSPGTALGSVQTAPVVGNSPSEPCHTFSFNWCHQAYRWNVDRIEDPNGRVTTFKYVQEKNFYGVRGYPQFFEPYVNGAVLVSIEYGQLRSSASTADQYSHAIQFHYHYRCNNPVSGTCSVEPTEANGASFPDIPTDQFCGEAYCTNYAPTFFTRSQLKFISTQVRNTSGALTNVGVDAFVTEWVDADGAGSDPPRLWLRTIQHNGQQGSSPIYLPAIRFDGASFPNRVDYSNPAGVTQMLYFRVNSIVDEYGSQIRVTYTQPKPCPSPWPSTPPAGWQGFQENSWSCYARWWTPPSGPAGFSVWHKYLVDRVEQIDQSAPPSQRSLARTWEYDYPDVAGNNGGMAWHSDRSPLVPVDQRSWGEYRGFQRVRVVSGNPSETNRMATETIFFRGMHNDINSHSDPNQPRDYVLTPGGYFSAFDEEQLSGLPREVRATDYSNSTATPGWELYSYSLTNYNSYPTTSLDGTSWQVEPSTVFTAQNYGGAARYGKIDYSYDSHPWMRRLVQTIDWGRASDTWANTNGDDGQPDEVCTTVQYTPPSADGGRFLNGLVWRQVAYGSADCASGPLSDVRTYYDDAPVSVTSAPAPTEAPWWGNPTATWRATGWGVMDDATGQYVAAVVDRTRYEWNGFFPQPGWGRPTAITNARGIETWMAYAPHSTSVAASGVKTLTTTNAVGHVAVSEFDLYGRPIRQTDPNDRSTYVCYDDLGRVTKVYEPGTPGGATCTASPSKTFAYQFSLVAGNDSPPVTVPTWAIQTRTLFALNGEAFNPTVSADTYLESWALFDGYGRSAQTNTPSPVGGRVTTRTIHDSQDRVLRQSQPFRTTETASAAWTIVPYTSIPRETSNELDPMGRPTRVRENYNGNSFRSTDTSYHADRVVQEQPRFDWFPNPYSNTVRWLDADGNEWKVTETDNDGANRDTLYRYDQAGHLARITDSLGNVTNLYWNMLGQQHKLDDPNAGTSEMRYYPSGEIRFTVDAANNKVYHRIDNVGRTISTHTSTGWSTANMLGAFGYDGFLASGTVAGAKGMLTLADAYSGGLLQTRTETIALDVAGRPTTTRITVPAADGPLGGDDPLVGPHTTSVAYTRTGTAWQQTYPGVAGTNLPNAETVNTRFNTLGLPTGIGTYTNSIQYDDTGRPVQTQMGPVGQQAGLTTQMAYQPEDGRLSRQTATNGAGQILQDDTLQYDAPGNPVRITHHSFWDDETECFDYDSRQRLQRAYTVAGVWFCAEPGTAVTPGGPAPYLDNYHVDQVGRITNFDGSARTHAATTPAGCGAGTQATKPHALRTSTGGGQTDTFTYNCVGAVTQQVTAGGPAPGKTTYAYDHQQRLVSTTNPQGTTTNVYDTTNNRVLRVDPDGSRTLYLGNTEVRYAPGLGTFVSRTYGQTRRSYIGIIANYAVNYQGSIVAGTGDVGTSRVRYTPYGAPRLDLPNNGTSLEDHNFLNQVDDPKTNTVNLNNRQYNPAMGVFLSVDPLRTSTSPYTYSAGNPIGMSDVSGLSGVRACPDGEGPDCFDPTARRPSRETDLARNQWDDFDLDVLEELTEMQVNYCTAYLFTCEENLATMTSNQPAWYLGDTYEAMAYEGTRLAVNHIHSMIDTGEVYADSLGIVRLRSSDDYWATAGLIQIDGPDRVAIQTVWRENDTGTLGIDFGCWIYVCLQIGGDSSGPFINAGIGLAFAPPGIFMSGADNGSGETNVFFASFTSPVFVGAGGTFEWAEGDEMGEGTNGGYMQFSLPGPSGGFVHWWRFDFSW